MPSKLVSQNPMGNGDFEFFRDRLLELTGIYLTIQKLSFLQLRLRSRLEDLGLKDFSAYRQYLVTLAPEHAEWQTLINRLTTNKTNFFREASHFDFLVKEFLPQWEKRYPNKKLLVWSAVCSTGEEPYSIAMVLDKYFKGADKFKIIASDVDTEALEHAMNGVYQKTQLKEIPPEYHSRSLSLGSDKVARWFRIKDCIHQKIQFLPHNLIKQQSPLNLKFDVIFCRNVFIYFRQETIGQIAQTLFDSATDEGALIIGHSESFQNVTQPWKYLSPSVFIKSKSEIIREPSNLQKILVKPTSAHTQKEAPKKIEDPPQMKADQLKKRVLIVDDSTTITKLLSTIFRQDAGLEVVGVINNPLEVEDKLRELKPDVMTLDINMPEMDGCAVLRKVMGKYPVPTVMISSISIEEGPRVLQALELGAIDYIQKPSFEQLKFLAPLIIEKIKDAANAKVQLKHGSSARAKPKVQMLLNKSSKLIAIGSSTGGTEALRQLLSELPNNIPPIVIVQHIPPVFSNAFAMRLNDLCECEVREAKDGDVVRSGLVLIAPGGIHMVLRPSSEGFVVRLQDLPAVNRHKPSVDMLFESVAQYLGRNAIGLILTGMGADGAKGLLKMRQAGARTIAQDEASCVVFGMPKEAIKLGAAEQICGLDEMPNVILSLISN